MALSLPVTGNREGEGEGGTSQWIRVEGERGGAVGWGRESEGRGNERHNLKYVANANTIKRLD